MARRGARDLTVGSLFALALVILALAVMAVGGESELFFKKTRYRVVFQDATGLLAGAPVRMDGVEIGTVSGIRLPTDPGRSGIEVQLSIDPDYTGRIREDSRAALRILQLLTNEKFVEVTSGSIRTPALAAGSGIALLDEVSVMQRGEAIAESLGEITVSLKNILGPLERGEGVLGQMLQDPEFGMQGLEALGKTADNLQALTGELVEGRGTVGRLLRDDELSGRLDELGRAVESLAAMLEAARAGEGAVGDLLADDGQARQAIDDLAASAAGLRRLVGELESDRGLLGRLLHDPEYSEALAADLGRTLRNAAEITEKINSGEGTLGALVNDRSVYEGAENIFAGANDSKFARWLTRRYRKKGIVAKEKEAEEAAEAAAELDPGP